ncbi:hypothetical protein BD310DRAFT_923887 [Dichomitus squalens]|uniref:Uncharacterized protein n=1 Tax=Dichomitus squalens TaxID=114155 RepID=A0A4Q9PYX2_9APHY|nr:hypothetical protein BD310DRAFT_923887 [Dichomitus squalens]
MPPTRNSTRGPFYCHCLQHCRGQRREVSRKTYDGHASTRHEPLRQGTRSRPVAP